MDSITLQQNPFIEEITTTVITDIPEEFREDVKTVVGILKAYRVSRVILYGSVARGDFHKDSDLDFCVEGLDARFFFIALAECLLNTVHSISIVDLNSIHGYFRERVLHEGTIVYEHA